ncbi:hypothetical protein MW887_006066 [Aspergillus wentii]|nr:hypothetical protein MW887_006066 [Aspergillus wentii]
MPEYKAYQTGTPNTKDFRTYLSRDNELCSPWHDVPLFVDDKRQVVNAVIEVPRWSNVKMEICKDEFLTPLSQVMKDDKTPRYVPNIFPHRGYPWNYGTLPQTYEDPTLHDTHTNLPGHGNGVNMCELSGELAHPGQVKRVKVLGAFAVIEAGRTDWKIVVVDVANPLARELSDIGDVEPVMPGYLGTMTEWFRIWRTADEGDNGVNFVAFNGEVRDRRFALMLLERCHASWKKLMTEPTMQAKLSMKDVPIGDLNLVDQIKQLKQGEGEKIDQRAVERFHFLAANWPLAASCPGLMDISNSQ